jgi:hypothetical protein
MSSPFFITEHSVIQSLYLTIKAFFMQPTLKPSPKNQRAKRSKQRALQKRWQERLCNQIIEKNPIFLVCT